MSDNIKGALFALFGFAIFAVHDVLVRVVGGNFSPFQMLFFTSLLSFPLLTVVLVQDATPGTMRPLHPWWVALRSLVMAGASVCGFYAFATLPLAQVYALLFTVPLLVTLMSIPLLGEKVGIHRAAAILLGLGGVIVVVQPGSAELGLGHLAAIIAALGAALQSVISRKIGHEERPVVMMLFPLLAIFAAMGASLTFVYEPMSLTDLSGMAAIALLGFVATFCLVAAYRKGEAAIVAPMQYSQIIWATLYGSFLFNETVTQPVIAGSALVIASGLYIVMREAFGGQSTNKPVTRTRTRGFAPGAMRVSELLRRKKN